MTAYELLTYSKFLTLIFVIRFTARAEKHENVTILSYFESSAMGGDVGKFLDFGEKYSRR
jgi:hypothetical protein